MTIRCFTICTLALMLWSPPAVAQPADPASAGSSSGAPALQADDDRAFDPAQPDFTVVNLPTTLRLPRHSWAFRLTHRFTRAIGEGDVGDLAADLFGFDSSAHVGLEFRFGLTSGTQIGFYRSNDKTIQFFGVRDLVPQRASVPVGLAALVSIEGLDNFQDEHVPAIGVVASRTFGPAVGDGGFRGGLYLAPMWIGNTNILSELTGGDDSSLILGVGVRLGLIANVYLVGEVAPRVAGYDPGRALASFGVERRAGGHVFQLNVSNSVFFSGTPGQLARAVGGDDWYIGFNLTRKFY